MTTVLPLPSTLDPAVIADAVTRALAEDLGSAGDITSEATVAADAVGTADYRTRAAGVVAGLPVLEAIFATHLPASASWEWSAADGDRVEVGAVVATVRGPIRAILGIERTSLNFLGHLSGVATLTRQWVDAVAGTGATIRDTRKTTPGLRLLEKYAVRCGGGVNHRIGLFDAVLIKDNHVQAAGGIGPALTAAQRRWAGSGVVIQVEVDTLDQLADAVARGATQVLLDNMSVADTAAAVAFVRAQPGRVELEASGGLTLATARAVAATGVDYLAVGALTHSAPVLDIGLDVR